MNPVWNNPEFDMREGVSLSEMQQWYNQSTAAMRPYGHGPGDESVNLGFTEPYDYGRIPVRIIEHEGGTGSTSPFYRAREVRFSPDRFVWEDREDGYQSPVDVFDFMEMNLQATVPIGYVTYAHRNEINEGWRFPYSVPGGPLSSGPGGGPNENTVTIVQINIDQFDGGSALVYEIYATFNFMVDFSTVNVYGTFNFWDTCTCSVYTSFLWQNLEITLNNNTTDLNVSFHPVVLITPTANYTITGIQSSTLRGSMVILYNQSDTYSFTLIVNTGTSGNQVTGRDNLVVPPKTGLQLLKTFTPGSTITNTWTVIGSSTNTNASSGGTGTSSWHRCPDRVLTYLDLIAGILVPAQARITLQNVPARSIIEGVAIRTKTTSAGVAITFDIGDVTVSSTDFISGASLPNAGDYAVNDPIAGGNAIPNFNGTEDIILTANASGGVIADLSAGEWEVWLKWAVLPG